MVRCVFSLCIVGLTAAVAMAQSSFVNWETPQVHPLDLVPGGAHLLATNTADNRLEVFAAGEAGLSYVGSVPVGLDPVSVRARTATEWWVINHVSDSISIVDFATMNVVRTITTGDEPTDVVFAGSPQRAFVAMSQLNSIYVYDPADPGADPAVLEIAGEDPRALATDGTRVFAAMFESGNRTTILPQTTVSSNVNPYPGNWNPPPNAGPDQFDFDPPLAGGLPTPPPVSLIVAKSASGQWVDDNGGDWSAAVTWDLHDHDVAIIEADTLAVSYVTGLMNANMGIAVSSAGTVTVVGTDAVNDVRFEPNLNGIFLRVIGAFFPAAGGPAAAVDLNPHLDYTTPTVAQEVRDASVGDPRGVAWDASGNEGFITGMGSNNVIVVDAAFNRLDRIEVGQGPTGVVVDDAAGAVYVLNRFENSISILNKASRLELGRLPLHDPTPQVIKDGRPHLYDTHRTSGLGQASCAGCHIDARMDQLAWDLGDPSGAVKPFNQQCNGGLPIGSCEDWHPMKGPMATQTLVGIVSTEPLHWRGDREDLPAFNGAFQSLLGDDESLTPEQMDAFLDFVATLVHPPNPFRHFDGSLPSSFANGGNPVSGETLYNNVGLDGGFLTCAQCHALPSGTNGTIISGNFLQETQSLKVPQLRNLYEKTGFDVTSSSNNRGFGFIHDGSVDTMFEFLMFNGFTFSNNQQRRDVEAFLMCLGTDTHAGVGTQATVIDAVTAPAQQVVLVNDMVALADSGAVGLVVKGRQGGIARGYAYVGGQQFQSDRQAELVIAEDLFAAAAIGSELTYTVVPVGTQTRIGIDRDEDGFLDGDELDAGSDPADAGSIPGESCLDLTGDDLIDALDLALLLGDWGPNPGSPADFNGDAVVDAADLALLLGGWGPC